MDSILSTGERQVARGIREGQSVAEIAAERDTTEQAVKQATNRIREKTERAVATLQQSPFTEEVLADLDEAERAALRDRLG